MFGRSRSVVDLHPADFRALKAKLVERWKTPAELWREIQNCRSVFRFAMRNGLVERIVRFGDEFTPPGQTELRQHRYEQKREHGERAFIAQQCRELLANANPQMKSDDPFSFELRLWEF